MLFIANCAAIYSISWLRTIPTVFFCLLQNLWIRDFAIELFASSFFDYAIIAVTGFYLRLRLSLIRISKSTVVLLVEDANYYCASLHRHKKKSDLPSYVQLPFKILIF